MSPPRLPVVAILAASFAFAFDRAGWRATVRLAWPALIVYAGLSAYEAANPPPDDTAFGSLEAVPWSAFALPFVTAAAMRVRAFGAGARLSLARRFSLGAWALAWNLLLGAGLALVALLALALLVAALALFPSEMRDALLVPLRAAPVATMLLGGAAAFGLVVAFVRLYLIIPAATADRAVGLRGAWALGRGNGLRLLTLALAVTGAADLAIGAAADAAALAFGSAALNTALYNALALVVNQWAAAAWSDAHRALDADEAADGMG
jgi:hypothetical protein